MIQLELKKRLKHCTQTRLARELGVSVQLINHSRRRVIPSPGVVKALGFRKVVTYERLPSALDAIPAQIQRTGLPAASIAALKAPQAVPRETYKLTVELVQVALKHKLNVGQAWASFLAAAQTLPVDSAQLQREFDVYCNGLAQSADTLLGDAALLTSDGLGEPGELYSHLKPVERGPDLRPPPAHGGNVRVKGE